MAEASSNEYMPPDRQNRNAARLSVTIPGHYKLKSGSDWLPCTLIDLAVGGIQLEGKLSFYPGDVIDVKFPIEDNFIICKAEVTNISGRKAGAKFTSINERHIKIISEYVERLIFLDQKGTLSS